MDQRMSKDKYYLNIADAVLDRSTCLRRKYGATKGYTGLMDCQARDKWKLDFARGIKNNISL